MGNVVFFQEEQSLDNWNENLRYLSWTKLFFLLNVLAKVSIREVLHYQVNILIRNIYQ